MIAVALLMISLTAALPNIYTEGQREREEELIFRGNEYARAIGLYHARFNRYPMKIEDLVNATNGIRFLRHAYTDPMTKGGKWRYIHANAFGVVVDSRILKNLANMAQGGAMGGPGGGIGSGLGPGTIGAVGGGTGVEQGAGQAGSNPSEGGQVEGGANPAGTTPSSTTPETGSQSTFSNDTTGMLIVGVASTSHKKSFRIWNKQKYYDDWEFLGIPSMISGLSGTMGPTPAGPSGMQPAQATTPVVTPTPNP